MRAAAERRAATTSLGAGNVRHAERAQERPGLGMDRLDAGREDLRAVELGDAHRAARGDGLVRRPDASQRRPELGVAGGLFPRRVEEAVVGEDDRGPVGDEEVVADLDAGGPDLLDLGEQRLEVDDDARTDDGRSSRERCRREAGAARSAACRT